MTNATVKIPGNLNTCGGEIQNAKLQSLASAPESASEAQFWYDSVNHKPMYHNGTSAKEFGKEYTFSTGLTETSGTVSVNTSIIASKTDIGTANLTIQRNGTSVGTFSANATEAATINISVPTTATEVGALPSSLKGAALGVAELDSSGKVPSSQLPAYVDDVIELLTISESAPETCSQGDMYYNSNSKKIFTATASNTWEDTGADPEKSIIYVTLDTNYTYRWSGSAMINLAGPVSAATETQAGIAEIATQQEVTTGTDDQRFITPLKLATHISGFTKKFTTTNTNLSVSNNVCTWQINHSLGSSDVQVSVYEVKTLPYTQRLTQVYPAVEIEDNSVSIYLLSSTNISAGKYKAVIVG